MNDYDMDSRVWDDAFSDWRSHMLAAIRTLRPHSSRSDIQTFRASVSLSICDFCSAPCSGCTRRYFSNPYARKDCSRDHLGVPAACYKCPYMPLEHPELDN